MLQNILWTYQHITVWHRKVPIIILENLKFSVSNCSVQFMWLCTKFIKRTVNKLHMWTQINTLINSILLRSWSKMCRVGYRVRKCGKFGFEKGVRSEFYHSQTYNRCKSSECYLPIQRRSLCTNVSPQACTTISSCGSSRLCDTKVTRKDVADLTAGASGNESVMIPVKQLHVKIIWQGVKIMSTGTYLTTLNNYLPVNTV